MQGLSDVMIYFAKPLGDDAIASAKALLMDADRSVLVHQKEGQSRVLLVRFHPDEITPRNLLDVVRTAGFEATMASG